MNSFSITNVVTGIFLFNLDLVNAHGRLTVPMTRFGPGYENDPVSGNTGDDFVCRNPAKDPEVTITAGGTLELGWEFGVNHVGDCAVYLSYDFDQANADQQYFKIANLPDCKSTTGATIELPEWLPSGRAVLRWDWYALHQYPAAEFYVQCVDLNIEGGSPVAKSEIDMYSIISPAVYPANGNTEPGYRDPHNANQAYAWKNGEQFMTGPACARGFTANNCELTAAGTTGNIAVGNGGSTPTPTTPAAPTPMPTPDPTNQGVQPTADPTSQNSGPVTTEKFYFDTTTDAGLKMTLTAIAGFLAQIGWESGGDAPFGYCDENNWSNSPTASCTQRADGQLYSSLTGEGACAVTNDMQMTAETSASWSVPMECTPGTDTETCCWWGRGAIQTTGPYNYGKLQNDVVSKMGLGVDLCTNPEAICQHDELAWVGGFYYWVTSVQGDNSNCFQPTLEAYGDNWDSVTAVPNCANFESGIGGAINNGAWNVQAHGNSNRLDYFAKFMAAMKTGYSNTAAGTIGTSETCTGNSMVDRILKSAGVKDLAVSSAVSNTMNNSAYKYAGFCEGFRTFIDTQGVSVTPSPTAAAVVTPSPTTPVNVVTPSPTFPVDDQPTCTCTNGMEFTITKDSVQEVANYLVGANNQQLAEDGTTTLGDNSANKSIVEHRDFWPFVIGGACASALLIVCQIAAYCIHRRRSKDHSGLKAPLTPRHLKLPKLSNQWMSSHKYETQKDDTEGHVNVQV